MPHARSGCTASRPVLCLSLQRFVFDMKVCHAAWSQHEALQMIRWTLFCMLLGHILLAAEDSLVAMHLRHGPLCCLWTSWSG